MNYKKGDIVYCKRNFVFLEDKIFEEGKSYIIDSDWPSFYDVLGVSFYKNSNSIMIDKKVLTLDNFFHDYFCTLKELRQIKLKRLKSLE
jgi:hypothetical protein